LLREPIGNLAIAIVKFALDINWWAAQKHVPKRYKDEMRGMADGHHRAIFKDLRRINMFPELT